MKKISHDFKKFNILIITFIILILFLTTFVDYPRSLPEINGEKLVIWMYDDAVGFNTGHTKGPGMLFSLIFNITAFIGLLYVSFKLWKIKKIKDHSYLSTNLFYTSLYLTVGRVIESYYIITETDVRSLLFVVGRIFIPLDNLAIVIFFGICFDVFFSERLEKDQSLRKGLIGFTWATFILGWGAISSYYTYNEVIDSIFSTVMIIIVALVLLVSIKIETEIRKLSNRVDEKKEEIKKIGKILFIFIAINLLTLLLIILYPDLFQYLLRALKNFLLTVVAVMYYSTFIKPMDQKIEGR